jgi:probable F420-dependent oxidoreductase
MEPIEVMLDYARDAEELGFEGVSLGEHVVIPTGDKTPHPTGFQLQHEMSWADPLCVFSAMAAVTERIRFVPFVYVVPMRHPVLLAKQIATVARLSNDRFTLGTGVGWLREEFEVVDEDFDNRGRRMDEMLDVMRDFWDDGYAEFHGEFYDFPHSAMIPPPNRQVPIWIGGQTTTAARRAARFDGYVPMDGLNERTRRDFAEIDAYRAEHGLDGPYDRVVTCPVGPDVDEIRRYEDAGITAVTVHPSRVWGLPDPGPYAEKRPLVRRFAEEVISRF